MRTIIFFCGLLTIAFAVKQELYKVPAEKLNRIQKISDACALEHNAGLGLLAKISDGTLPRDKAHGKYLYCTTLRAGVIEEDGHVIVDKFAGLLTDDHPLLDTFKEFLKKCNKVTKENPVATVMAMQLCIVEEGPVRFYV